VGSQKTHAALEKHGFECSHLFLVQTREHWTGEVSADEWVPVFPVFNWPLVLRKKYFVYLKMTYSSRYSFVACIPGTLSIPCANYLLYSKVNLEFLFTFKYFWILTRANSEENLHRFSDKLIKCLFPFCSKIDKKCVQRIRRDGILIYVHFFQILFSSNFFFYETAVLILTLFSRLKLDM